MNLSQLLFTFQGRIGRGAFWLGTVLAWVYYVLAYTTYHWLGGLHAGPGGAGAGMTSTLQEVLGIAILLFSVGMIIWMDLALQVKRWHDRDKSGLWVLICLAPVVGILWALVECGFLPSAPGENRFGLTDVLEEAEETEEGFSHAEHA